jgi:hypothetical protein
MPPPKLAQLAVEVRLCDKCHGPGERWLDTYWLCAACADAYDLQLESERLGLQPERKCKRPK